MMTWLSCSKIAASIAFAQLWQRGDVALDDCGLGLALDSKIHHADRNCASGYRLHASPRAFGHSGFRTTVALCDPEPGLVICCSWNGMPGDDATHLARQNALCEAVYGDLGLVA